MCRIKLNEGEYTIYKKVSHILRGVPESASNLKIFKTFPTAVITKKKWERRCLSGQQRPEVGHSEHDFDPEGTWKILKSI